MKNYKSLKNEYELSEDFIKKHKDKIYWKNILEYQKLSKSFIETFEDFEDKVYWRKS